LKDGSSICVTAKSDKLTESMLLRIGSLTYKFLNKLKVLFIETVNNSKRHIRKNALTDARVDGRTDGLTTGKHNAFADTY